MLAVPKSPLSLCEALRQLESNTWLELEAGVAVRQRLDEESLTAYHLMRLARAVREISIQKHTRRREARTGADWEWWVGRPGAFLGFRVQAKIVDATSVEYKSLFGSASTPRKQVDKLIRAAENQGRNTFPIYAFYNYWLPTSGVPTSWPCPRPSTTRYSVGWTIASAYDIERHLAGWRHSKKARDLSSFMYPVSCPFCCECTPDVNEPPKPLAVRLHDWLSARWTENRAPEVVSRAPAYVEELFRLGDFSSRLPNYKLESDIPDDISRLMLVRDLAPEA